MKSDKQQAIAAAAFAERWKGRGYEKGDSQVFWTELLTEVFGIENPSTFIRYEEQVKVDKTNFIDGHIPSTRVLIEQKSIDKDLRKGIVQSDGSLLNPFQQAKRYVANMPLSEHPKWIVTCNFAEFLVYDMEQPNGEPEQILLKNLGKEYYRLQFLVDAKNDHLRKEMEVSMQAGEIVGRIYEALLKQYDDNSPEALRWLNILCVRIVFCLYAEDAGIFSHDQFYNYLVTYEAKDLRRAIRDLFEVLNTPQDKRSKYLQEDLAAFPYTNGGLFAEDIEIPQFTEELKETLLQNASLDFDWSEISPTIFGAVFESTLNPETRRSGGMHYTSIENIHKVIDPLFLNDLRSELDEILDEKVEKQRVRKLDAYQDKLASLTFLDPACGSGNFLTETYLSLRRLENEVIRERYHGQTMIGAFFNPIKVSIQQFYGIEINDFAVTVATTALWISEAQMLNETERIVHQDIDFLPLKSYTNIHEGNALRIEWESVVPKDHLNYIIGNPPFVGVNYMTDGQRDDMDNIWSETKRGKLDYVTCWYMKATDMMVGTSVRTALVSTNSVTQGEQAAVMWKVLFLKGVHIDFAHRTFIWDNEASLKAHVHCVIVGFSWAQNNIQKYIYYSGKGIKSNIINGYLLDAPVVIIEERSKPLCNVPSIVRGSQATDDGYYLFTPEEKATFLIKEPQAEKYFKRFMMGREFINHIERWCLWMPNITPTELKSCPEILKRVQLVKDMRESSKNKQTQMSANIPWRFGQYREPARHYIAFAKVSSERRRYVPMGFLTNEVIPGDKLFTIPDATIYMFGVLTSNVHMAWMRTVCGRLKSDYSYSTTIVYNNFPWPNPTDEQKTKIEQTAQAILDARALYPDSSLADLYDELTMPVELRKAHQDNDRAVMAAYGFPIKGMTESQCVAELFKLYKDFTNTKK
jgi:hypothetical protein